MTLHIQEKQQEGEVQCLSVLVYLSKRSDKNGGKQTKPNSKRILILLKAIFVVMGVVLVAVVTLLNMTVSVGTLNGLILFANILQANKTTFLP